MKWKGEGITEPKHYKCSCGVDVIEIDNNDRSRRVVVDAAIDSLLTFADYKIYGQVFGHRLHRCGRQTSLRLEATEKTGGSGEG